MTSVGLRQFQYDAARRLAKVKVYREGQAASVEYLVNALGQRVFKSEPQPDDLPPQQETLDPGFVNWLRKTFGWLFATGNGAKDLLGTSFVYDEGWHLLGEYPNGGASGKGAMEYVWLPLENGDAIPIGLYRNRQLYAVHTDHLGTPRLVTDSTKQPVWQWPYSAFGNNKPTGPLAAAVGADGKETLKATPPAIELNLRMPGQYYDAESGLANNGFREYAAGQGRYIQFDPIGLAGGWNGYTYAENTPLTKTDALGLQATAAAGGGVGGAGGLGGLGGLGGAAGGYNRQTDRFNPAQPIAWPKLLPDSWVDWIIEQCTSNNCPPCKTVTGKVVPVGTIAYRPMDTPPPGKVEHGIAGPHYNIYKANQAPQNSSKPCHCFWQPLGAVPPSGLPAGAIPIEAFAN